jgi:sugar lactone lactonase YvrE
VNTPALETIEKNENVLATPKTKHMKFSIYSISVVALIFISCETDNKNIANSPLEKSAEHLPYLTFQKETLFPGDSSLSRPEDGVALADGRIIVSDQAKGLRLIEKDGSSRPFGNFSEVGFVHNPPETPAAPNGLFLEHDKQHLLMCDYFTGKIYRTNISSEKVALVYDHSFGVNAVYRDKTGAIWFSQTSKSTNLGESINSTIPTGAIFRLADSQSVATTIADSLYLANGITMDQDEKTLFVAETLMNRVLSFDVDITSGKTTSSGVVAIVLTPDNILIDNKGRLIIASPGASHVTAVNLSNHSQQLIFDASTSDSRKIADEWFRRSQLGIPRAELLTPKIYGPLPSLLTGMFFSQDGRTLYIATLGKDILKLDYK